jgi:hypothetical protein
MTEDNRERIGLSTAQVAGSALAAVSAAFLASFAGTTGTVIGAAIGSVVATVGAATYTWSLRRTSAVVRRTAAQVRQTTLINGPLPRTVVQGPLRSEDEREGPEEPPSAAMEEAADDESRRRLPWVKVLVASLAVTLAVLGGITVVEAITGKPIASWLGGSSQTSGTTVGDLVRSDKSSPNKDKGTEKDKGDKPAPSETASPNTPTDPETPEPSQPPDDPEPSQPAVPEPSTAP